MSRVIIDHVSVDAPPQLVYTKRYDYDGSGNQIYEGWASSAPNPATSDAVWAVKKKTYNGSNKLTIEQWANGATTEVNAWDQRASLTYK